ncbi:hypothetical protein CCR95_23620 [Thiocystis minor]|nr:hypothetical protein [Thiocystis minor]
MCIPATVASAVLALLVTGCATAPSEIRSKSRPIKDCPPESSTPLARELALDAAGLAVDSLVPGASLLIAAAELASQQRTETPRLAPTGFANTTASRVAIYRGGHRAPILVLQSGLGRPIPITGGAWTWRHRP